MVGHGADPGVPLTRGPSSWLLAALVLLATPAGLAAESAQDPLTEEQRAWLEAEGNITVAVHTRGPAAARLDADGNLSGYFPDLLRLAALEVGANIRFQHVTSIEAGIEAMRQGEVHLAGPMAARPDLQGSAVASKPLAWVPIVILVPDTVVDIQGLEDLAGKRVGIIDGSPGHQQLLDEVPEAKVLPVGGVPSGIEALVNGSRDVFVGPLAAIGHVMKTEGIEGLHPVGEPLALRTVHAWAPARTQALSIVDRGLDHVSPQEAGLIHVSTTGFELTQAHGVQQPVPGWFIWGGIGLVAAVGVVGAWAGALRVQVRRRTRELEAHRDHLEELVEARTEALERSNQELEHFASSVSHDLRGPLSSTEGFLYILDEELDEADEDTRELIDRARGSLRRMDELVDGLLRFSRLESSQQAEPGPVDLGTLTEEVRTDLAAQLKESGGRLEVDPLPTVQGDRAQLRQVLANLLTNALKFAHPERSPVVEITAETRDRTAVVSVADNGIGLDPEHAEEAFELFGRLEGGQDREGTGVGLAICQKIVDRHGGRLWVEEGREVGTEFRIELPLAGSQT